MRRSLSPLAVAASFVALIAFLSVGRFTHAGEAQGGSAHDIKGKFVSYDSGSGMLKIHVAGGHLKGDHDYQVPAGIPVLVYADANHPEMHHSPDGLQNISSDSMVQVTTDSRDFVIRISVTGGKKSKK